MSEPIGSIDSGRIDFSSGGLPEDVSDRTRHYPAAAPELSGLQAYTRSSKIVTRADAEAVQSRLNEAGSRVRVGIESVNGNTVFTIRDSETGTVIRKIPNDEAIRIANNLDTLTGLYVDRVE